MTSVGLVENVGDGGEGLVFVRTAHVFVGLYFPVICISLISEIEGRLSLKLT